MSVRGQIVRSNCLEKGQVCGENACVCGHTDLVASPCKESKLLNFSKPVSLLQNGPESVVAEAGSYQLRRASC